MALKDRLVRFASAVQGDFHQDQLVSNILVGYIASTTKSMTDVSFVTQCSLSRR